MATISTSDQVRLVRTFTQKKPHPEEDFLLGLN